MYKRQVIKQNLLSKYVLFSSLILRPRLEAFHHHFIKTRVKKIS